MLEDLLEFFFNKILLAKYYVLYVFPINLYYCYSVLQ